MNVRVYKMSGNYEAYIYPYSEVISADTLPAAICAAVDTALKDAEHSNKEENDEQENGH